MPSSRRAPSSGAFSHAHQTRPVEGPPVRAWIRERAFSFPCGREADSPRAMEAIRTTPKRQANPRRRGREGHGACIFSVALVKFREFRTEKTRRRAGVSPPRFFRCPRFFHPVDSPPRVAANASPETASGAFFPVCCFGGVVTPRPGIGELAPFFNPF